MKKQTLIFENVAEFKSFLSCVKYMPIDANRKVNDKNVNDIKLSVIEIGVERAINVVYTNVFNKNNKFDYYFLDGQHLAKAIMNTDDSLLHGHFVFFIDEILDYEKIVYALSKLNSVGQKRKLAEYLRSWVFEDRESYVYLAELMRVNPNYTINSLIECLTGKKCTGNEDFKNGKLALTNKQKTNAKKIIDLHKKLMQTGLKHTSNSFAALVRFVIDNPEVKFDTIYKKVKKSTSNLKEIKGRDVFVSTLKILCSQE